MAIPTPFPSLRTVLLATGGTIAGTAATPGDHTGYRAGQLPATALVAAVPQLAGLDLVTEQVAQLDSKDMDTATWAALVRRVALHLADPAVGGIVVTHGTDTLEETAWLLHRVLTPAKPVVLACAMRPATALAPDGPQNLADAVAVARSGAAGVFAVCAGRIHAGDRVRKVHTYRLDAFDSGDAGPLGWVEQDAVVWASNRPVASVPAALLAIKLEADWPRVECVTSHGGADGALVDALLRDPQPAQPLRGIVVAGTGNGTVHHALEAALARAEAAGVRVLRATRCAAGRVLPVAGARFGATCDLSPAQARIALAIDLMQAGP